MPHKILVIDSSPNIQEAVRLAFPENEFEVVPFTRGRDGLDSLANIDPDIVLLNIALRDASGYEIGSYLRSLKSYRSVPLILLTGAFETPIPELVEDLNCDEIISEPFDSRQLAGTVRMLLSGGRSPDSLPEELSSGDRNESIIPAAGMGAGKGLTKEEEMIYRIVDRVRREIQEWLKADSSGSKAGDQEPS